MFFLNINEIICFSTKLINMPQKSKIDKLLFEKNELFQVARECKFFIKLEIDQSQAFETLFEKLGIRNFTCKNHKNIVKRRIKRFFTKHKSHFKKVSYQFMVEF